MALTNGPNLDLLVNGTAGEEHYDELMAQWRGFDALIQCRVSDRDLSAPPGSPGDGDTYIVAASPSGTWTGHAKHIARWSSVESAWEFYPPHSGWRAHVVDEAINVTYIAGAWTPDATGGGSGLYHVGASWSGAGTNIVAEDADLVAVVAHTTGVITRATVLTQGGPGDCAIDVWKDTYTNYPPAVGDTITASAKPTITSGVKYKDSTLTGWTTSVTAGDILLFKLESAVGFTNINIFIEITP